MSEYGDKACIEAGIDVVINVINSKTYNAINIYRNISGEDVLIDTKTDIEDFTISDIQYGKYTFELTDGTNTSQSTLIAVGMTCSYDKETKRVDFSSENAEAVSVQDYNDTGDDPTQQNYGLNEGHNYLITDEDRTAGYCIIGDNYNNILVNFKTEYGVAVWLSKPLSDIWEPFEYTGN